MRAEAVEDDDAMQRLLLKDKHSMKQIHKLALARAASLGDAEGLRYLLERRPEAKTKSPRSSDSCCTISFNRCCIFASFIRFPPLQFVA